MYGINTACVKGVGGDNGRLPEDSFDRTIASCAALETGLLLTYLWSRQSLSCCGEVGSALL